MQSWLVTQATYYKTLETNKLGFQRIAYWIWYFSFGNHMKRLAGKFRSCFKTQKQCTCLIFRMEITKENYGYIIQQFKNREKNARTLNWQADTCLVIYICMYRTYGWISYTGTWPKIYKLKKNLKRWLSFKDIFYRKLLLQSKRRGKIGINKHHIIPNSNVSSIQCMDDSKNLNVRIKFPKFSRAFVRCYITRICRISRFSFYFIDSVPEWHLNLKNYALP